MFISTQSIVSSALLAATICSAKPNASYQNRYGAQNLRVRQSSGNGVGGRFGTHGSTQDQIQSAINAIGTQPQPSQAPSPAGDIPVTTVSNNATIYGIPATAPIQPQGQNVSDIRAQLPHVAAAITQTDGNETVTLTLNNTFSSTLFVWKDLSFLTPGVENATIKVVNNDGSALQVKKGLQIPSAPAGSLLSPLNLVPIAAGQSWSRVVDLSSVFDIPADGSYQVSLAATLIGSAESNQSAWGNVTSYMIAVDADPVQVSLHASASTSSSDRRRRQMDFSAYDKIRDIISSADEVIYQCNDDDRKKVENAIHASVEMAQSALNDTNWDWLRRYYFGSSWSTDSEWKVVLQNIANYNISGDKRLRFICDRKNELEPCASTNILERLVSDAVQAWETSYVDGSNDAIVLCSAYLDLDAFNPWFPSQLWSGEQPYDQQVVLFHELTHSQNLNGDKFTDDVPDKSWYTFLQGLGLNDVACYRYSCATALASGPWDNWKPWNNAQNFALYAKSVRDCRLSGSCGHGDSPGELLYSNTP